MVSVLSLALEIGGLRQSVMSIGWLYYYYYHCDILRHLT